MNRHQKRLEALIMQAAAAFLEKEAVRGRLVTVAGCSLSPDLRTATIWLSVFPESESAPALRETEQLAGRLRTELGGKIKTKNIPEVRFVLDMIEK